MRMRTILLFSLLVAVVGCKREETKPARVPAMGTPGAASPAENAPGGEHPRIVPAPGPAAVTGTPAPDPQRPLPGPDSVPAPPILQLKRASVACVQKCEAQRYPD